MDPNDERRLRHAAILRNLPPTTFRSHPVAGVGTDATPRTSLDGSDALVSSAQGRMAAVLVQQQCQQQPAGLGPIRSVDPTTNSAAATMAAAYRTLEYAAALERTASTTRLQQQRPLGARLSLSAASISPSLLLGQAQPHALPIHEGLQLAALQQQQQQQQQQEQHVAAIVATAVGRLGGGETPSPAATHSMPPSWGVRNTPLPSRLLSPLIAVATTTSAADRQSLLLQLSQQQHRQYQQQHQILSQPHDTTVNPIRRRKRSDDSRDFSNIRHKGSSSGGGLPARKRRIWIQPQEDENMLPLSFSGTVRGGGGGVGARQSASQHSSKSSAFPLPLQQATKSMHTSSDAPVTHENDITATMSKSFPVLELDSYQSLWDRCRTKTGFLRRLHDGNVPVVKDTSITGRYTTTTKPDDRASDRGQSSPASLSQPTKETEV